MSEDMRFRFKERPKQPNNSKRETRKSSDDSKSIFGIWDEQRRLQEADEKIAKELAEAKKKAKELQRTLRKNKYGDINNKFTDKANIFITKLKTYKSKYSVLILKNIKKHKKTSYSIAGLFFIFVTVILVNGFIRSDNGTATLGESTATIPVTDDLPREKPNFSILFPEGKTEKDFDVVRISPPEADASYTFLDRFTLDGQIFRVTQQEIPDKFDLKKTATDFQATDIIQVDDTLIYHGYSEEGGIQSIIFTKENKLISIRSSQKFSDDQWANYFISLK